MPADPRTFREVLSRFATGVTVVTMSDNGRHHGLTVNAFSSVSETPPRVLICLANHTRSKALIERSGSYAVHMLGREQKLLAQRFARLLSDVDDPFDGLETRVESTGCPILRHCIAWLDCRVDAVLPAGDHTIFVGAVEAAHPGSESEPILYYRRGWRVLN